MTTVACPYCESALTKLPQRKTKCPHCGNPIYVKRPFGFPRGTKMLMTEQNAALEEKKWRIDTSMDEWRKLLASIDIDETEFDYEHQRLNANDDGASAVRYLVNTVIKTEKDLHRLKMASHILARVAIKQGRNPINFIREAYRFELMGYKNEGVKSVMIRKPQPWQPALEMAELHRVGLDIAEIAKKTNYSIKTVERALENNGEDSRTGPQCEPWMGKEIDIDEALQMMPLPCGPNCACWYQTTISGLK